MLKFKLSIFVENGDCFHINLISHISRFFYSFLKRAPNSNICISRNIKYHFWGCISKSKLAFPEYNIIYLSAIAFIVFTLHQIKQRKFFLGHPVVVAVVDVKYELRYYS
jgi:hypothetical protein